MESTYKYCANCNEAQLSESKFCSNCAHDLSQSTPAQEIVYQVEEPANFLFKYKEILCLLVFAIVLSSAGFAFYTRYERDTQNLSNKLSNLDKKLSELETKVSSKPTGNDTEEVLSKLYDLERDLTEIQKDMFSVKSNVTDIKATVDDVKLAAESVLSKVD